MAERLPVGEARRHQHPEHLVDPVQHRSGIVYCPAATMARPGCCTISRRMLRPSAHSRSSHGWSVRAGLEVADDRVDDQAEELVLVLEVPVERRPRTPQASPRRRIVRPSTPCSARSRRAVDDDLGRGRAASAAFACAPTRVYLNGVKVRPSIDAEEDPGPMPFTDNDGVRLHWDERGEGTPVLLVMGRRFSSEMWYPVIPAPGRAPPGRVVRQPRHRAERLDPGTPPSTTSAPTPWPSGRGRDRAAPTRTGCRWAAASCRRWRCPSPNGSPSIVLGCTRRRRRRPRARSRGRWSPLPPPRPPPVRMLAKRAKPGLYGTSTRDEAIERDLAMLARTAPSPRRARPGEGDRRATARPPRRWPPSSKPALVLHGTADTAVPYAWGEELARHHPRRPPRDLRGRGAQLHRGRARPRQRRGAGLPGPGRRG